MGLGEQRQHALPVPVQVIQRGSGEHLGREREGFLPRGLVQGIFTLVSGLVSLILYQNFCEKVPHSSCKVCKHTRKHVRS